VTLARQLKEHWRCPDVVWDILEQLIPEKKIGPAGGRPPCDQRAIADGIFYVTRTGIQWKAAPPNFPSGSSLHKYFQDWASKGVFQRLLEECVARCVDFKGINWGTLCVDTSHVKAPLGGEKKR
jgi:putative transposase